jgi:hypothetical protein
MPLRLSSAVWPCSGLYTAQIALDFIMVLGSGHRNLGNVFFRPTSDLFFVDKSEKKGPNPPVYGRANVNEGGHGFKVPSSLAASSSPNMLGYNNNGQPYQIQVYPPSPGTSQGSLTRRVNPAVDEYADMSNQAQYEKAQYSQQPTQPSYPQSPVSPYN